jgi:tetratricopeptide (TPR) repeat protein
MTVNPTAFIVSLIFIISVTLCLSSCTSTDDKSGSALKQYVQTADSLVLMGKGDSAITLLTKQRSQFKNNNPQLSAYYEFMSMYYHGIDTAAVTRYADSAIAVFNNTANIDKYPREYFKALLAKGDASIIAKQYETALAYYDKAKKTIIRH